MQKEIVLCYYGLMKETKTPTKDFIDIYSHAYTMLKDRTPVMFDCGNLCSSACCHDNGLGMLLFPYEDIFINSIPNDFIIKNSNIVIDGYTVKLLYCKGTCNRNIRPLACRIFPLFPYTYEDNRVSVKFDPRASGTCPLLLTDVEGIYMSGVFRLMIYKTALMLIDNPLIQAFLIHMTKELETIGSFKLNL